MHEELCKLLDKGEPKDGDEGGDGGGTIRPKKLRR